jgi:hypothetical protein
MNTYKFYKEGLSWYIDLPEYLAQGGSKGDLQMVDGADTMLDLMAKGEPSVVLQISEEPFTGADLVALQEKCDPSIGGGNYFMASFEGEAVQQRMWLCQVTEFVFGYLPDQIFVRRVEGSVDI